MFQRGSGPAARVTGAPATVCAPRASNGRLERRPRRTVSQRHPGMPEGVVNSEERETGSCLEPGVAFTYSLPADRGELRDLPAVVLNANTPCLTVTFAAGVKVPVPAPVESSSRSMIAKS